MSGRSQPAATQPITMVPMASDYVPGVCNIGPWEIRRRRAYAITGFAVAIVMLAALVANGSPAATRLVLILPLWGGMFSWLQARRRFCAGFAMAGISNFGDGGGSRRAVVDPAARRADVAATLRLTRDSFLLAIVPTAVALLLPF